MRTYVRFVLTLILLGTITGIATAQPVQDVVVAGIVVLRIRVPAGGLSVAERADLVTRRITLALTAENLEPSNFLLQPASGSVAIRVGRITLITVTSADAQANATTVQALAGQWLRALRAALPRAKPLTRP